MKDQTEEVVALVKLNGNWRLTTQFSEEWDAGDWRIVIGSGYHARRRGRERLRRVCNSNRDRHLRETERS